MKKVIHTLTLVIVCALLNAQDMIQTVPVQMDPVVCAQLSDPAAGDADTMSTERNCDGYMMIYNRNQQLCKKGTFRKCVLTDGQEYVYDSNGALIQIKRYEKGKYVGDAELPEHR
jgi:hypothetical protein